MIKFHPKFLKNVCIFLITILELKIRKNGNRISQTLKDSGTSEIIAFKLRRIYPSIDPFTIIRCYVAFTPPGNYGSLKYPCLL